jgi:competence protein ComEC
VIDAERLQKSGATALRRTGGGFVTDAIRPKGVDRPWAPAAREAEEAEPGASRPSVRGVADVTPAEADVQADE